MSGATLTLAFSAGMAAAVNPCGFALLPAYLSYYLGLEAPAPAASGAAGEGADPTSTIPRAVLVGSSMTAGFVVVFAIVGVFWSSISSVVSDRLPWVTFAIGLMLVAGGVAALFGVRLWLRLPKVQFGSANRDVASVFLFGVSYAVASLSCTIPVFISVLSTTFRHESVALGVTAFVVYALGMGAIVVVLTLAVASARLGVVRVLRRAMPHMDRISGAFLVVAGAFVAYYGWWEAQVVADPRRTGGLGAHIQGWQDSISGWIQDTGELRLGLACAAVIAGALGIAFILRRRLASSPDDVVSFDG